MTASEVDLIGTGKGPVGVGKVDPMARSAVAVHSRATEESGMFVVPLRMHAVCNTCHEERYPHCALTVFRRRSSTQTASAYPALLNLLSAKLKAHPTALFGLTRPHLLSSAITQIFQTRVFFDTKMWECLRQARLERAQNDPE